MTSLKFDVNLTVDNSEWAKRFIQASSSDRAIMLSQVMDAFNDGVGGIELSFSEPVSIEQVHAREASAEGLPSEEN